MTLRVAVFGSSRATTPEAYKKAAYELGQWLATKDYICVNGGGGQGVMGAANDGVRSCKGKIIGVIHQQFCVDNDEDSKITDMIVARGTDLNERKQLLMDNCDCFVVLPGGTGTFDELWDIVSHRSLGMKNLVNKPILLFNQSGFYDGFIQQLERAFTDQLLYNPVSQYYSVATSLKEVKLWVEKHDHAMKVLPDLGRSADSRVTTRAQPQPASDAVINSNSISLSRIQLACVIAISALAGAAVSRAIKL